MRRRYLALWAGLLFSAGACAGGSHHSAPTTTAPSGGPNPDVIPSVITPAYVNAVFRVLNHINGDASRALLAAGKVTPGVLTDLRAIFNDPLYAQEVKIAQQSIAGNLSNVRRPPGDTKTTVENLIWATSTCVFAMVLQDYSQVTVRPEPAAPPGYWGLEPKAQGDDPLHLNPTPWALSFNAVFPTPPTSIPNPCSES